MSRVPRINTIPIFAGCATSSHDYVGHQSTAAASASRSSLLPYYDEVPVGDFRSGSDRNTVVMNKQIVAFAYDTCPLSFSYPCELNIQGITFGSALQAAYYLKYTMLKAWKLAAKAKAADPRVLCDIPELMHASGDRLWNPPRYRKCRNSLIVQLLVEKYRQCPEFSAMVDSCPADRRLTKIVWDAPDLEFATGLTYEDPAFRRRYSGNGVGVTTTEDYPGCNSYGECLKLFLENRDWVLATGTLPVYVTKSAKSANFEVDAIVYQALKVIPRSVLRSFRPGSEFLVVADSCFRGLLGQFGTAIEFVPEIPLFSVLCGVNNVVNVLRSFFDLPKYRAVIFLPGSLRIKPENGVDFERNCAAICALCPNATVFITEYWLDQVASPGEAASVANYILEASMVSLNPNVQILKITDLLVDCSDKTEMIDATLQPTKYCVAFLAEALAVRAPFLTLSHGGPEEPFVNVQYASMKGTRPKVPVVDPPGKRKNWSKRPKPQLPEQCTYIQQAPSGTGVKEIDTSVSEPLAKKRKYDGIQVDSGPSWRIHGKLVPEICSIGVPESSDPASGSSLAKTSSEPAVTSDGIAAGPSTVPVAGGYQRFLDSHSRAAVRASGPQEDTQELAQRHLQIAAGILPSLTFDRNTMIVHDAYIAISGDSCPLSFSYPCRMAIGDLVFSSALQAFYWLKFKHLRADRLAAKAKAAHPHHLPRMMEFAKIASLQEYHFARVVGRRRSLVNQLLLIKYKTCAEFAQMVNVIVPRIMYWDTLDKELGTGTEDLSSFHQRYATPHRFNIQPMPGHNHFGKLMVPFMKNPMDRKLRKGKRRGKTGLLFDIPKFAKLKPFKFKASSINPRHAALRYLIIADTSYDGLKGIHGTDIVTVPKLRLQATHGDGYVDIVAALRQVPNVRLYKAVVVVPEYAPQPLVAFNLTESLKSLGPLIDVQSYVFLATAWLDRPQYGSTRIDLACRVLSDCVGLFSERLQMVSIAQYLNEIAHPASDLVSSDGGLSKYGLAFVTESLVRELPFLSLTYVEADEPFFELQYKEVGLKARKFIDPIRSIDSVGSEEGDLASESECEEGEIVEDEDVYPDSLEAVSHVAAGLTAGICSSGNQLENSGTVARPCFDPEPSASEESLAEQQHRIPCPVERPNFDVDPSPVASPTIPTETDCSGVPGLISNNDNRDRVGLVPSSHLASADPSAVPPELFAEDEEGSMSRFVLSTQEETAWSKLEHILKSDALRSVTSADSMNVLATNSLKELLTQVNKAFNPAERGGSFDHHIAAKLRRLDFEGRDVSVYSDCVTTLLELGCVHK